MKNIEKNKGHDLEKIIEETLSLKVLVRLARATEPPAIAYEYIPDDKLLGAMEFLNYAAAFSEAT
jgi:hypothetical protein